MEEQKAILEQRRNYNLDEKIRLLIWDYEHGQLSKLKHDYFAELIKEKLKEEIAEELEFILKKILGEISWVK